MANQRTAPYHGFNFQVNLNHEGFAGPDTVLGGFSDVSGLTTEVQMQEYRNGSEKKNHVRKMPGLYKAGDVTLKRGVVSSLDFFNWIEKVRTKGVEEQSTVIVTLMDEADKPVQKWILRNAVPMKYTGPTLAGAKGDLAMEEVVLAVEDFEIEAAKG